MIPMILSNTGSVLTNNDHPTRNAQTFGGGDTVGYGIHKKVVMFFSH